MIYNMTQRAAEAWEHFDAILEEKTARIAELAKVDKAQLIKLNPAEFIEKNQWQTIDNYHYIPIKLWIDKNKHDDTYLISPMDAIEETAEQIGYKAETTTTRKIRASKCEIIPVPRDVALDFFIRNHRQTLPNVSKGAILLGLVYDGELVSVMHYDTAAGAVRGAKEGYELVRLAIARNTQVHGGASKLQKACEEVMEQMGVVKIFSYSNATINNGRVYEKLGFKSGKVDNGQPFVIMKDNRLERLITLHPYSTDEELALRGQLKTHIGGNKLWTKDIKKEGGDNAEITTRTGTGSPGES